LRKERGIQIRKDKMMIKTFNWRKEVDLVIKLWLKCKNDDEKSKGKAGKYANRLMERCGELVYCT
jgi:hypothetical protein